MIVWLASYPRSGNTLLRIIFKEAFGLRTYSSHGDLSDIAADADLRTAVGHEPLPDDFDIDEARSSEDLYVIKTHSFLHPAEADKVIYIVRDGRDACVSYMKYLNTFGSGDIDLLDVIHGSVRFGNWSDHVRHWTTTLDNSKNFLVVRFEDLLTPEEKIQQIGDFLKLPIKTNTLPSFDELHRINPEFFRSGTSGTWKEQFSDRERVLFHALHSDMLEEFGYEKSLSSKINMSELFAPAASWLAKQFFKHQEALQNQNRRLQKDLDSANASREEIEKKLYRVQTQRQEKNQEVSHLRENIQSLTNQFASKDTQITELHREKSKLASERDSARGKIETLRKENLSLEVKLTAVYGERSEKESLILLLREKADELKSDKAEAEAALTKAYSKLSEREAAVAMLRQKIEHAEELSSSLNQLKNEHEKLLGSRRLSFINFLLKPMDLIRAISKRS